MYSVLFPALRRKTEEAVPVVYGVYWEGKRGMDSRWFIEEGRRGRTHDVGIVDCLRDRGIHNWDICKPPAVSIQSQIDSL